MSESEEVPFEVTKRNFDKHILFMEPDKDSGIFSFLGPYGWTPCDERQNEVLKKERAWFKPAAGFVDPENSGAMSAFGVFVIPGVLKK